MLSDSQFVSLSLMSIAQKINAIESELPAGVTLVAVSKTKPNELLMEAYNAGQRVFGENRIHELVEKHPALPKDIKWHMIGHLQSKKVKQIAPFIAMIHSVDSAKLLGVINSQAERNNRVIDVLLQFHIAKEESKFGLSLDDACTLLGSSEFGAMEHVRVCGVMGMATFTDDQSVVRSEFQKLKNIFDSLKAEFFSDLAHFKEISMGMSGDYRLAIEEGSTMVRIGSTIFGKRY